MADGKDIGAKDVFEKIEKLELDKHQMDALEEFFIHIDDYEQTLIKISEFIATMEPDIDMKKIQQKIEELERSYPPTIVSGFNRTEKWLLFNNLARRYLAMTMGGTESL